MQSKIIQLIKFLNKYLFKDTKYCLLYLFRLLIKDKDLNVSFYSLSEVIEQINNGKSIIRIGDGEIGLLHYLPIHYQKWSPEIRSEFIKIIKEYGENKNYILGIPVFVNYKNTELKNLENRLQPERSKLFVWLPLKISFELLFKRNLKYVDQHIFYKYNDCREFMTFLLSINKKIVFVSDIDSIGEIKKDNFLKGRIEYFIETPPRDSFENRGLIKDKLENLCKENFLNKDNSIVIFKGGLAKTIIYELCDQYQLLDIGKGLISYTKNENIEGLI